MTTWSSKAAALEPNASAEIEAARRLFGEFDAADYNVPWWHFALAILCNVIVWGTVGVGVYWLWELTK